MRYKIVTRVYESGRRTHTPYVKKWWVWHPLDQYGNISSIERYWKYFGNAEKSIDNHKALGEKVKRKFTKYYEYT